MDTSLLQSIQGFVAKDSRIRLLPHEEAEHLRSHIRQRFAFQPDQIWWWESAAPALVIDYGLHNEDGVDALAKLLKEFTDEEMRVFVTDDEPPPWVCLAAPLGALIDLLREQRFFEFFVVDAEARWIIFDTHHNQLIKVVASE